MIFQGSERMSPRVRILLITLFAAVILIAAWYFLFRQTNQDVLLVSVSTDKEDYHAGETVHIIIQNLRDGPIDIYCPEWCALGNFPTEVERFSNGQWQYFAGFCPSIEPLFETGVHEGHYIRHTLSAMSSIEVEISNLQALHIQQDENLRIVYYLGADKVPIYSNEFTVMP